MTKKDRIVTSILGRAPTALGILLTLQTSASVQAASPTSSGLAGGAAATALGAGLNAGTGSTSSSGSGAGGGANASIEINIMVYQGMARLASNVASAAAMAFCHGAEKCNQLPILVEDATSANQVGLYQALTAYFDQMQSAHEDLSPLLALALSADSLPVKFTSKALKQTVTITNAGAQTIDFTATVSGPQGAQFDWDPSSSCNGRLPPASACNVVLKYSAKSKSDMAEFDVQIQTPRGPYVYQIPLVGSSQAAPAPKKDGADNGGPDRNAGDSAAVAAAGAGTGTGSGSSSGNASSQPPQWASNFGTIGGAIEALKTGMSYSSANVQPTIQSFQVMAENELKAKGFVPYLATSPLDLQHSVDELTSLFVKMLTWSNDFTNWTSSCKPVTAPAKASVTACSSAQVQAELAAGQQILNGYSTLLQTSNDGQGNSVLMDVLRGAVLSKAMDKKFRSIQLNVAAAGGSTRVNSWFLENIFYVPKPSYNGGVIVTFELRDENNVFLQSGTRTAFYDFNKRWKGGKFDPNVVSSEKDCKAGTFCIAR